MTKHILYFVVGLIFAPVALIIAMHTFGKEIVTATKTGYKKGVIKWMNKKD